MSCVKIRGDVWVGVVGCLQWGRGLFRCREEEEGEIEEGRVNDQVIY
jgi:hypothetical protein